MINEVATHENALLFWIVSFELWELNSLKLIIQQLLLLYIELQLDYH